MFIKTPSELEAAINIAINEDIRYIEVIQAICKYKWYNWYQNLHIKIDSPEDIENTRLFNLLKENHPKINSDVEHLISVEIEKLNDDMLD